jgi:putative DNA primase/helicase
MFGLCLTDVTSFQRFFMFIGPPRGGRGTIGRVLKGLIGAENYVGTSFKRFGEQFGMEGFIGKKVAVFTDASLDGQSARYRGGIVEQLKRITGEDDDDVNRKHKPYWHGKLSTRVLVFSNELLKLEDQSGALGDRVIVYRMLQSFKDRMDPKLTDKLLAERPGIFNLALDGWDRVRLNGLRQPESGLEMATNFQELGSDVKSFITECCVVGPQFREHLQDLYDAWKGWCFGHGVHYNWDDNHFSAKLSAACPTLRKSRPRVANPDRLTMIHGIGLRPKG